MTAPAARRPTRLKILAWKPRPERQTLAMESVITSEPLELEYLFTVLEGHDVTLLDGMTDRRDPVQVARELNLQVVLATSFITNVETVLATAARLKEAPFPPLFFVGGPHAEVCPEHFFHPAVDGVFFANALAGIRELARRVAGGESFHDLPGAAFQGRNGWIRNPGPPLDPATLPVPRRVLFESHPERYFYLYFDRCASVKTAFGCHEKCTFCFCTEQHGGKYGPRPVPAVVDEIAGLPATNVFLLDDNFLSSRARVLEFCDAIAARGIRKRFILYGGADFVARNPDVMARLRDAGAAALIVGFEFVQDRDLEAVNKRARLQDNEATLQVCRELDIEPMALFMVDPDWTEEDFRRLRDYVRSRGIVFATFSTYTVFPGTQLARTQPAPPAAPWWRYDLLRLHRPPRHLTPMRYYLWLFYLYLLPGLTPGAGRRLRRLYGTWGYLKLLARSTWIGIEYLAKLAFWK